MQREKERERERERESLLVAILIRAKQQVQSLTWSPGRGQGIFHAPTIQIQDTIKNITNVTTMDTEYTKQETNRSSQDCVFAES